MGRKVFLFEGLLQALIGIGAVVCGLFLVFEPSGNKLGLPLELLSDSPFENYLIPGLLLFSVNGVGNVFGSILSFRRNKYSGYTGMLFGLALILWIIVQIMMIGLVSWLQPFYLLLGMLELLLGVVIYKKLKNGSNQEQTI
jgi:hypothetical protein